MDLLIERSREILERADPENKARVETEVNSVSGEWTQLISGLEARRDALTKLAHHWEVCIFSDSVFCIFGFRVLYIFFSFS